MMDPWQSADPRGKRAGAQKSKAGRPDTPEDSGQLTLNEAPAPALDPEQARRRRDEGARAAELNTFTPWRQRADRWVEQMAATGLEFTADDLLESLGRPVASSTQAVGPVFLSAARRGVIRKVGYVQSRQASRNGSVIAVWVGTTASRDAA